MIGLMAKILHHLGWCKNHANNSDKPPFPQLVIAGFWPSTVSSFIACIRTNGGSPSPSVSEVLVGEGRGEFEVRKAKATINQQLKWQCM